MCFQSQSPRRCSLLEATKPHTHRFPPARCWDSTLHKPRHCDVSSRDTRRNSRALTLRWKGARPDAVQVFDDRGSSTHLYRLAWRRGGWRGLSLQMLGRSARPSVHVPVSQSTGVNVVVQWLPLLLRIREVQGQISVRGPAIQTEVSSVPPVKFWDSALNQATTASFNILSNSSLIYHYFIRRYIM
jgi:hypothetical protein